MMTLPSDVMPPDIDPFDNPPPPNGDSPPVRCTECGNGFEQRVGPGRKSTKCPDCRSSKSSSGSNGGGGGKAPDSAVAAKLERSINAMAAMTAMLIALRNTADAQIIATKTPPLAKALGNWGAENKRVRKYIEGSANSLAAVSVIFTAFDLVWSLLANHDLVPHGPKRGKPPVSEDGAVVYPFHATEGVNT